jgi:hypothetical protein
MDDSELLSSFQLLTDNQRDIEHANQAMFKKRRYESKPSVVKIMKQSGSTLNSHAY